MYLLSAIVDENATWCPDDPALIEGDTVISWRECAIRIQRLRRGLAAKGIVRGSRIAMLDRNSIDYVLLHYALMGMGAVLIPINIWYRAAEIAYVLENSQPFGLVVGGEFMPQVEEMLSRIDSIRLTVLRGDLVGDYTTWDEIADGASYDGPISEPEGWDDAHMILYTSGTTGRPKGTLISHRRSVYDALSAIAAFGIRPGERFLCYLPLFHTGAWDYLKLYFLQGGSAVIMDRFDPEVALRQIEQHRCNGMFGVPLVLREMMESTRFPSTDLSSMRLVAYGSYDPSDIMLRVLEAFRRQGAERLGLAHAYGLTEGGPFVAILRPEWAVDRTDSVGRPLPGTRVTLLDEELRSVPMGTLGEICVQSPAIMSGYLNRPEATAEALAGGWLHTGDIGLIDEAGFLYVVDRKKDMIRTGGENVFAKEVEQVIVSHPDVRDCAVIGIPDADYDERVVAVVVRNAAAELGEADLIQFVRSRIAGFKTPREVHFVDEIPKTSAGKTAKAELRSSFAGAVAMQRTQSAITKGRDHR